MSAARIGSARKPRRRKPRVVIDTNVVLSALVFCKGTTQALRTAWQSGLCVPLVSRVTVQELMRVLAYPKFRLDLSARKELLSDYLPHTLTVTVPEPPPAVPDCRDPFDVPLLHLAVAGSADALVTGDGDLLVLNQVGGCPILSPQSFIESFLSG